jgi:hypothetical protein
MDFFDDRTIMENHLKFQGSNDNFASSETIEDIVIIGEDIHEGWNYYDL